MTTQRFGARATTVVILLTLVSLFGHSATAANLGLGQTSDGGCYLVDWEMNYVISTATGCDSSTPCIDINWTTTPPQAIIVEC